MPRSASAQSSEISSRKGLAPQWGHQKGERTRKSYERHLQFGVCTSQASILLMTVNAPSPAFCEPVWLTGDIVHSSKQVGSVVLSK